MAGGYNGEYLASAEMYDPATGAWAATGEMHLPRAYHAMALLQTGQLWVAGGSNESGLIDEPETYDAVSGQWALANPLPVFYDLPLTTVLDDGSVLITGRVVQAEVPAPAKCAAPAPIAAGTPQPMAQRAPAQQNGSGAKLTGASEENADASGVAAEGMAGATASTSNFTRDKEIARLFGVHEISFTLPIGSNPYDHEVTVTFTPTLALEDVKTVMAFYDGPYTDEKHDTWERWGARVYVDHVGGWSWKPSEANGETFTAEADPTFKLRGMLRVAASTPGAPGKRWYTDDGQTFLPMADTAYRLFFDTPSEGMPGRNCPPPRPTATAQAFIEGYAADVKNHGINVLRIESLGTWAYPSRQEPTPTPTPTGPTPTPTRTPTGPTPNLAECETDLSLFWADDKDGIDEELLDAQPSINALHSYTTVPLYFPNLTSFKSTDQKLEWLLNAYPEIYIQMILVPEPEDTGQDHTWNDPNDGIAVEYRRQIWRTMVARWAAFPNIFWTISNDLDDSASSTNTRALMNEVGCYLGGAVNPSTCNGIPIHNPWRLNRPISAGHLRNAPDSFASDPSASWHTYITSYSDYDLSAQQMDGTRFLPERYPEVPTPTSQPTVEYAYATRQPKPVYNVEDQYEGSYREKVKTPTPTPTAQKNLRDADYFYRRLFWSNLLSGSGATYGAEPTWQGLTKYSNGNYKVDDSSCSGNICPLVGLKSIANIPTVLAQTHTDLGGFVPLDQFIPRSTSPYLANDQWYEFMRAQVAVRSDKELLAYIPYAYLPDDPAIFYPDYNARRLVTPVSGAPMQFKLKLAENGFNDEQYKLTWYDPKNGTPVASTIIPRILPTTTAQKTPTPANGTLIVTPPPGLTGDMVLHLSSRCIGQNKCEPMDEPIPVHTPSNLEWVFNSTAQFQAGDDETALRDEDPNIHVFGTNSWRCDRPTAPGSGYPGCWVRYDFDSGRSIASADFYYRRNSRSAYQGLYFITTKSQESSDPIIDGSSAKSIDIWFGTEGDLHLGVSPDKLGAVEPSWQNVTPDANRWYHVFAKIKREGAGDAVYQVRICVDGVCGYSWDIDFEKSDQGDPYFRRTVVHSAWWGQTTDLPGGSTPSIWLDELSIDPPPASEQQGLYHAYFQQDLGGYDGTRATYFDGTAGYDGANFLRVGANNSNKGLLRFNVSALPPEAVIDEATLALYYAGRSNANTFTLGVHSVLAEWHAGEVNRIQRQTGMNWVLAGMGAGSDYKAAPEATLNIVGEGNAWIELDVTALAQAWVNDPAQNHGLVLQQAAASGYVVYSFCSDVAQSPATPEPPCVLGHAPKLTLRYHLTPPTPGKTTFQRGAGGYTGNTATYFDGAAGYNNSAYLRISSDNYSKSLLRFDVTSVPITETIAEASLRVFPITSSNANHLTIAAHKILSNWTDSQANRLQRQTGVNWQVAGMGAGSDYNTEADGAAELAGFGAGWVELDVTKMVRDWVADPTSNQGLVLLAQSASGSVNYGLCSELGWSPCTTVQAPVLTIWHYPPPPTPEPEP